MNWTTNKRVRDILSGLERLDSAQPEPIEEVPEYVGDLADTVKMSEGYAAAFGMMKKQCLENGLSETETEAYLIMWMNLMQSGVVE